MVLSSEYPLHLGLAYLFLVGYLLRTIFVGLRLPGAVGVIASGFAFSFFMQPELLQGRDHLQSLAFFLVLLTAGMEISLGDLKPYIILSATVPATFELAGIAAYAHYVLEWTRVESCVLGITLFGLGDGLVIPKMADFAQQFPGHPLPRLLFLWAPLEASYALTLFGVISGVAAPAGKESASLSLLVTANVFRILATLCVGAAAGAVVGWVVSNRTKLPVPFTGTTVEAYLFILATALAGYGVSSEEAGSPLVPMGFVSGGLFQPELMVIVIGSLFARVVEPEVLRSVEVTMGGVWVFGQLVLFSMLGSRTDLTLFNQILMVLPIFVVGLSLRFLGVLLVTACTLWWRPCTCPACFKANKESLLTDATFCFLSTLPRATLQGALGQVPITARFFQEDVNRRQVQHFISMAARLYIVCMSVLGSILLDAFGPRMLAANKLHHVRCLRQQKEEEAHSRPSDVQLSPTANAFCKRISSPLGVEELAAGESEMSADTPFLNRKRSAEQFSLSSEPRIGSLPDPLSVRMASWSTLHQLEGHLVEGSWAESSWAEHESEIEEGASTTLPPVGGPEDCSFAAAASVAASVEEGCVFESAGFAVEESGAGSDERSCSSCHRGSGSTATGSTASGACGGSPRSGGMYSPEPSRRMIVELGV